MIEKDDDDDNDDGDDDDDDGGGGGDDDDEYDHQHDHQFDQYDQYVQCCFVVLLFCCFLGGTGLGTTRWNIPLY